MRRSPEIAELAAALAAANTELHNPRNNREAGDSRKSWEYADLGEVTETTRPILATHGLSVVQEIRDREHHGVDEVGALTMVLHESGQFLRCRPFWMPVDDQYGGRGGAATTSRRLGYLAALSLGPADDPENPKKPRRQTSSSGGKATGPQVARILREIDRLHMAEKTARSWLERDFKIVGPEKQLPELLKNLDKTAASKAIERLINFGAGHGDPETGEVA